jgi:hypothetical protein
VLAQGKSPHRGILIDFLVDLHKSARVSLPVYSVSGEQGFVWVASYDREGEGTLRFFAMDPPYSTGLPLQEIQSQGTNTGRKVA